MRLDYKTLSMALAMAIAAPGPVWAVGGGAGGGCAGLPEYYRAKGALQGLANCDMSMEQARRVIAAQDGPAAASPTVTTAPPARHQHYLQRAPQQ